MGSGAHEGRVSPAGTGRNFRGGMPAGVLLSTLRLLLAKGNTSRGRASAEQASRSALRILIIA